MNIEMNMKQKRTLRRYWNRAYSEDAVMINADISFFNPLFSGIHSFVKLSIFRAVKLLLRRYYDRYIFGFLEHILKFVYKMLYLVYFFSIIVDFLIMSC